MTREVITISPESSISDAALLMTQRHVRRLVVAHDDPDGKRLLGIITRSNVYAAFPAELNPFSPNAIDRCRIAVKVSSAMCSDVVTTSPEAPIEVAARKMRDGKVGSLPVVRHQRLVGIITESDIFRAFIELVDSSPGEVRVTFQSLPNEDALALVLKTSQAHDVHLASVLSTHCGGQPMCMARVSGPGVERFIEALCQAHHPPLSVVRS